jgi:hypothetical protein
VLVHDDPARLAVCEHVEHVPDPPLGLDEPLRERDPGPLGAVPSSGSDVRERVERESPIDGFLPVTMLPWISFGQSR